MNAISRVLLGSLATISTVQASSPTAMDLALSLRVLNAHTQVLTPGNAGLLEFTIDVRLAPRSSVAFSTVQTPVPSDHGQPIRIFTPSGISNACNVQQSLLYPPSGTTDAFWYVPGPAVPSGGSFTCIAGFEILAPATRPMSLSFQAGAGPTGTTLIHFDLTPEDNFSYLPFGTPAAPVPAGTPAAWLLMAVLLAWLARRRFSDVRRRSRPPA